MESEKQELSAADVDSLASVVDQSIYPDAEPQPTPLGEPAELQPSGATDALPVAADSIEEQLISRVASALEAEFTFMTADETGWRKAASGVVKRLSVTSGDEPGTFRLI